MNLQSNLHMDKAAFLAWVQGRAERYELADGRVLMMTGGSRAHGQLPGISSDLWIRDSTRIGGPSCLTLESTSDPKQSAIPI